MLTVLADLVKRVSSSAVKIAMPGGEGLPQCQADFRGSLSAANEVRCLPFCVAQTNPQLAQRKYWTPGDRSVRGKAYTGSRRQHIGQGVASTTGTDCVAPRSGMSTLVGTAPPRYRRRKRSICRAADSSGLVRWSRRHLGRRLPRCDRPTGRAPNAPSLVHPYAMRQQTWHARQAVYRCP